MGASRAQKGIARRASSKLLVSAALAAIAIAMTLPAAPASAAVAVAASPAAGAASPALTLVSQTDWVTAAHPTFDLVLAAGAGTPSVSQLGITLALYPCLGTPSGFDQSVTSKSGPSGTPLTKTTNPVPWTSLTPAAGGGVDVPIPVVTNGSSSSATGAALGGFTARLSDCDVANGGVYPVRVQLVDTQHSNAEVGALTTHLVYSTAPANTQKLRFAWELPIQTPIPAAPAAPPASTLAANALSALSKPSAATLDRLAQVADAVSAAPSVPVTMAVATQTLHALDVDGHASTVSALRAANQADRQYLWTPYVPVDAGALVDSGLTGELTLQLSTGWVGVATVSKAPAPDVIGTAGAWITNDPIDDATLAQLQKQGYNQVVIPASDVTSTPTPSVGGSTAAPFTIASGHGASFNALTADADISSRFAANPGDPVLAAHQLLADLAQIYFEGGNTQSVRGVVAVPPTDWSADPAFVKTLLGGLAAQNPVVQAVTVTGLFQALGAPVACRAQGCKLAAAPQSGGGLPVTAISNQRNRLDSFSKAATAQSAQAPISQISNLLLSAQSETLGSAQQARIVSRTASALNAQLGQLSVAGDKSFTLTARNGNIPVTIGSTAGYPVKGVLTLTSDRLTFPGGTSRYSEPVLLNKSTNNRYVPVQARASGEFKVTVTLTSPTGGLILTRGAVTVRSTATSVVGIILSLGAVAVLLAWWLRTTVRRRGQRRAEQARGTAAP
ncbi:MAG TPA: DUF6049 family protein [Acidimicrobiales bacterium]|nr:DUF6049 family protein [Acidimicrobiales bacterium]